MSSCPQILLPQIDMLALVVFAVLSLLLSALSSDQRPPLAISRDRCTTMAVGRLAGVEGTMATHTADCAECDWRINKVPAADHEPGAMRPIYLLTGSYPRQVREDRGSTWHPRNLEDLPQRNRWERMRGEILGYIPQAPHTFAILEGMYGIMNEHQVAIGESTCAYVMFEWNIFRGIVDCTPQISAMGSADWSRWWQGVVGGV